jgi:prepilin-type processing-associated H-X9-DG protein
VKVMPIQKKVQAFTLLELVVVTLAVGILALVFFAPKNNRARARTKLQTCAVNLKAIGAAFGAWSLDHNDKRPMQVSTNQGGTLEVIDGPTAFLQFKALPNEFITPKVLNCPTDVRLAATTFGPGFSNTNVSYFVSINVDDTNPQMLLSGDRNLTNGVLPPNRILELTTNSLVGWTHELHNRMGNVLLVDGSVQQFSSSRLQQALCAPGVTNRLAIP